MTNFLLDSHSLLWGVFCEFKVWSILFFRLCCAIFSPVLHWKCYDDGTRDHLRDDVIKWKRFPRYWSFVKGIHRSPVDSPHKGQWRGALIFSLIYAWTNGWANNRDAGDLRRHRAHYDVIVMNWEFPSKFKFDGKLFLLLLDSRWSDRYQSFHMTQQLCCRWLTMKM